ncbi:hypothetical protein D3C78_1232360 [compost metagenome]
MAGLDQLQVAGAIQPLDEGLGGPQGGRHRGRGVVCQLAGIDIAQDAQGAPHGFAALPLLADLPLTGDGRRFDAHVLDQAQGLLAEQVGAGDHFDMPRAQQGLQVAAHGVVMHLGVACQAVAGEAVRLLADGFPDTLAVGLLAHHLQVDRLAASHQKPLRAGASPVNQPRLPHWARLMLSSSWAEASEWTR